MKKTIALALILGVLIGWRMTILNGNIEVDKANEHIGYFAADVIRLLASLGWRYKDTIKPGMFK